jgi:poly(A) polymerase
VRRLFRRARLVGRRFKIAHVRYGREVIEVSTFRKASADLEEGDRHADSDGMILRDNVYGTLDEDAFRRDFTVNALYYDPHDQTILDFVGGLEDLERHTLRFIGDTRERLQEDPVRLLRAIRFQAKLGFTLDPSIVLEMELASLRLNAIPPARLFDEFAKLFLSGFAARSWDLVRASPIRRAMFPATPPDSQLVELAMASTDARVAEDKPITPGFLIAVLLWHDFEARRLECEASGATDASLVAGHETLLGQRQVIAIPRRYSQFATEVWQMQARLERRPARQIGRLLDHPRFRAGYDFLALRADSGALEIELADWWTRIQEVDATERDAMIAELPSEQRTRRRKRRRRSRTS